MNINNIKAIRREHKQKYSDPGGYDLITLPRVSAFTLPCAIEQLNQLAIVACSLLLAILCTGLLLSLFLPVEM